MAAKRGRKSAAEKAAEAAALEATETVVETTVEATKEIAQVVAEPETASEVSAPEVEEPAPEAPTEPSSEPVEEPAPVAPTEPETAPEEPVEPIPEQIEPEVVEEPEVTEAVAAQVELEADFKPILRPTSVAGEPKGYIAAPRAVFEAVQIEGWQDLIESHPAKHALKSVLYWKNINGSATVRCMSSSRFADVV